MGEEGSREKVKSHPSSLLVLNPFMSTLHALTQDRDESFVTSMAVLDAYDVTPSSLQNGLTVLAMKSFVPFTRAWHSHTTNNTGCGAACCCDSELLAEEVEDEEGRGGRVVGVLAKEMVACVIVDEAIDPRGSLASDEGLFEKKHRALLTAEWLL